MDVLGDLCCLDGLLDCIMCNLNTDLIKPAGDKTISPNWVKRRSSYHCTNTKPYVSSVADSAAGASLDTERSVVA